MGGLEDGNLGPGVRRLLHDLLEDNVSGGIQHADAKMVHASVKSAVTLTSIPDDDPVDRLLAAQVNFPPGVILKSGMSIGMGAILADGIAIDGVFWRENT